MLHPPPLEHLPSTVEHLPSSSIAPSHLEAIGTGFAWMSSHEARRADRVAAPLRASRHAHLTTPGRQIVGSSSNFGPRSTLDSLFRRHTGHRNHRASRRSSLLALLVPLCDLCSLWLVKHAPRTEFRRGPAALMATDPLLIYQFRERTPLPLFSEP